MRYRQCIRRMRMEKSHRDPLLQIADMLNGAIYRYVREGDERFYRLIAIHTTLWRR
ncbi:MAG: DUF3800 domain-containing protein [Chloroflexi bacterium]|nr:DUF3800 domain-containing protein [Chloroflexota bacterium]MBI3763115.1 DUF3800 domain-containing protein [Chloroflexota bacterium]